jgi:NADPH:quinone reductase-like Zn-dependent oxidoreductase
MYGIASKSKHPILNEYGATPIDYRTEDFVQAIRRAEPGGIDAVFDGVGGDYIERALPLLRRGGVAVGYGNPLSMRGLCSTTEGLSWRIGLSSSDCSRREIRPVISGEFPLLEAVRANALLESGQVVGNLVLVSPELLRASTTI